MRITKPCIVGLALVAAAGVAFAADLLKKEKEILLAGATSFDYLVVEGSKLYVAHSPSIDVVDLAKGERTGSVEGVDGAHGTVIIPSLKRGFASAGSKSLLVVFDTETLKVTKTIPTGKKPDAVILVTTVNEVWCMNGKDGTITCVDPSSLEVKKTIEVGGVLESPVESPSRGMVYVNVEDKSEVAVIDVKKHECIAHWSLKPDGEAPTGIGLDEKAGVLICGCSDSKTLVALDVSTGKSLGKVPMGDGCDGVAYDSETKLAYASCGKDGVVTIAHLGDDKKLEAKGQVETHKGGRTCTFDKASHKLFVAAASKGEKGVTVVILAPAK